MGGFFVESDKNWKCVVDGSQVQVVTGNKNDWVGGHTLTIVKGAKTFYIRGWLNDFLSGIKLEIITPWEVKWVIGNTTDLFVGGKYEMVIAISFELNKSWTLHHGIPGQKKFITNDKLESLEHELLVESYKQQVGNEYRNLVKTLEDIGTMTEKVKQLTENAKSVATNISLWSIQTSSMIIKCNTLNLKISGDSKYDVAKMYVKGKPNVLIKGGSIKLDGGGATLAVGGGVKANTMSLTC